MPLRLLKAFSMVMGIDIFIDERERANLNLALFLWTHRFATLKILSTALQITNGKMVD